MLLIQPTKQLMKIGNTTYSRQKAVYPNINQVNNKFWPPIGRVDNAYGDRNLICNCLPLKIMKKIATVSNLNEIL